ncbi:MAG TPA: HisA/HisF-related TIM barrel protein, partial [Gemmatales bacterium]|nr:HisA/HisF-related TIM barrel protein [Gemmatales bacterium]
MALAPLIPVLDLRRGQLVQARGGVRHLYEPLVCPLCSSTEPQALVQVLRERYGFRTFYLADLDALSGWALALPIYHRLAELGASLWVDAGLADMPTVQAVLDHEAERAIIALESLVQPEIVPTLIAAHGPNRIMFSLDLNEGRPITRIAEWQGQSAR